MIEHHYCTLGGEVKKQLSGVRTGLRCSEALGRAYGLDWDGRLFFKLENLKWPALMMKRYVDNLNSVLKEI